MFVSSLQLRDSQYHLFVQPALSFRCKELQSCSVKVPVVALVTLVTKEVKKWSMWPSLLALPLVLAIRDVHDKATVLEQAGPTKKETLWEPAFLAIIPQGFPKVAIKNWFFWMNAAPDMFFQNPRKIQPVAANPH